MVGRRLATAALASAALVAGPLAGAAHAQGEAVSYVVDGSVDAHGVLNLSETITLGDSAPGQLTQRIATSAPAEHKMEYHYTIGGLKATAGGADLGAQVSDDAGYKVIRIDTAKAKGKPIVISYTVSGATHADPAVSGRPATTTMDYRVLQGLSVGVDEVSGTIKAPSLVSQVDCKAGPPVNPVACNSWTGGTGEEPNPTFTDGPRGAGEVVQVSFTTQAQGMAASESIDHQWSLDRAFEPSATSLLLALATLVLGALGLWALHRRTGRDVAAASRPTLIAEFVPVGAGEEEFHLVEDIRPGQIGTVADESVDPIDVTATLLDLAVRGHLRIRELGPESQHKPMDWSFERREGGRGQLRPYEQVLLDAVAPLDGRVVKVSGIASAIGDVIPQVQDELYEDVVRQGWFDKRPDEARNGWMLLGWISLTLAVLVAGLLVAFTTLGLWGLALIAIAAGVVFLAPRMPRRSARGSQLLAGLHVLAHDLQNHRTDQMPRGQELRELSELLPYAVVLGGRGRWLEAFADADDDATPDPTDLDWYHAPDTWHLADLPDSVTAFITSVQGHLFGR
ncbi:DUF2207 domain-containing protein [Aestuariimicrobium sp. T2.26MG-19.2B]|uniref:DUF2207 domain-containing protein n=1 Tax=Aestuariimicrobium sp. T2.26MG-19.2B TaxID=3040679 RepID=UPI0024779FA0|nr:DUF2207 domain-containing protein [Aestuariimicrobium sp. T2.26MG-19.2B]CAI9401231.1 hypothetical protein AESSP_00551 [Aestuariimicrobium sp. T2.26MG-19.2B]